MKIIYMLLLLLVTTNLTILAQVSDSVAFKIELSELNVIGSIRADENTPVTQKTLSLSEIHKFSYGQELPMFLNNSQSVITQSDAGNYYGYTYMRLRGIDQTRINFTLNGVPLNEPEDQGAYFNNYVDFTNSIQSMQIQRGVGTSTNGVASFGGSINFQSLSLANKFIEAEVGLASYNTHRYTLAYCTGIQNNYSIYARYSDVQSDGYKYHSANDSRSFYLNTGLFYDNDIIKYTGFYGFQKNQMAYLATSIYDIRIDPRTNYLSSNEWDNFKYLFNSVQYITQRIPNIILTSTFYYIRLNGGYDYLYSPDMYNYNLKSNFYGFITNANTKFDDIKLDGGIHINWYERQHNGILKPNTNLYSNKGDKNEFSIFGKISYDYYGATFYGDLQFRTVHFKYIPDINSGVNVAPITWNFLNPKIGFLFKLNDNIVYYSSIGYMQREPNRLDMFQGYDNIDTYNYTDVGNLSQVKPEKVSDIEGGIKFTYDDFYFNINGFSMEFQDEIAAVGKYSEIYSLPLRKNVPKSNRYGVEFEFYWKLNEFFSILNNTTLMKAQINTYKTDYDSLIYYNVSPLLTPATISNTTFTYDAKAFEVSLTGKYVSQSYLNNENTVKLPQYYIWDFTLKIPFSYFLLDFRVNNITDQQYYTGGYVNINEPGIPYYFVQMPLNFVGTLKVRL